MNARAVAPGSTLAGRYRIEDLVGETAGARTWRAFDSVLNRSVGVQVLSADDPRRPAFLEAARRSTVVTDPRFLRVLDVAEDEDGIAYTIREWARTVPLAMVLAEGPMANRRAASLVTEIAEAMAQAHEVGVQHRRLDLSTVHVKDTGAVRITGLGTDHALRSPALVPAQRTGDTEETMTPGPGFGTAAQYAAELSDVHGIGRILYACLVARWPGNRDAGLPPAPTEHGRLLRPRQVRAGVSRDIDAVVDRILGSPPRHHLTPLVTARDVATELALVGEDELLLDDTQSSLVDMAAVAAAGFNGSRLDPPPALLPASRPRATPPAPPAEPPEADASRRAVRSAIRTHRQLLGVGVALLVLIAASMAYVVGRHSVSDDPLVLPERNGRQSASPGGPAPNTEVVTLDIESVEDFDPQGTDGGENPDTAPLVADGDLETAWTTSQYLTSPELGNLKEGVGLLVDLGQERTIRSFDAFFGGAPTTYELYAAGEGADAPPTTIEELGQPFASQTANGSDEPVNRVQLGNRVTTRWVVLWLTSLPEESEGSGTYRGEVRELRFDGVVQ